MSRSVFSNSISDYVKVMNECGVEEINTNRFIQWNELGNSTPILKHANYISALIYFAFMNESRWHLVFTTYVKIRKICSLYYLKTIQFQKKCISCQIFKLIFCMKWFGLNQKGFGKLKVFQWKKTMRKNNLKIQI